MSRNHNRQHALLGLGLGLVLGKDPRLLRVHNQTNQRNSGKDFLDGDGKSGLLRIEGLAAKEDEFQERGHAAVVRILQDNGRDAIDKERETNGKDNSHHVQLARRHGFVGSRPAVEFGQIFLAVREDLVGLKGVTGGQNRQNDVFEETHTEPYLNCICGSAGGTSMLAVVTCMYKKEKKQRDNLL